MIWIALSFLFFTVMVAVISAWKTRDDKLDTAEGYFLAGRGLPGIVIAGSLLLTNLSAEQLVGTNGQGWASNMSPIGWEVGALFTLFALALWFLPTYLKMGTTTIPQLMEARFGRGTKLMFSFVIVVMYSILNLPVILYSGAVVFENIFDIYGIFGISKFQSVAILCVVIGIIGRGHLEYGQGTPYQLADLGMTDTAVLLTSDEDQWQPEPSRKMADAVFRIDRPEPRAVRIAMPKNKESQKTQNE